MINTGELVKRLRQEKPVRVADAGWTAAARHWAGATRAASLALDVADGAARRRWSPGRRRLGRTGGRLGATRARCGRRTCPAAGPARRRPAPASTRMPCYFAACVGTMFGPAGRRRRGATAAASARSAQAGRRRSWSPDEHRRRCAAARRGSPRACAAARGDDGPGAAARCGRPPGGRAARRRATRRPAPRACARCWRPTAEPYAEIRVVDAVAFAAETLLPRLTITRRWSRWRCTPPARPPGWASTTRCAGVAEAVADASTVPVNWGCCAFAGDRGHAAPRADGVGHRAAGRGGRGLAGSTRTPPATAPASWA